MCTNAWNEETKRDRLLSVVPSDRTRGNRSKLKSLKFYLNIRQFSTVTKNSHRGVVNSRLQRYARPRQAAGGGPAWTGVSDKMTSRVHFDLNPGCSLAKAVEVHPDRQHEKGWTNIGILRVRMGKVPDWHPVLDIQWFSFSLHCPYFIDVGLFFLSRSVCV